jgi:hypothetical protein
MPVKTQFVDLVHTVAFCCPPSHSLDKFIPTQNAYSIFEGPRNPKCSRDRIASALQEEQNGLYAQHDSCIGVGTKGPRVVAVWLALRYILVSLATETIYFAPYCSSSSNA